MLTASDISGAYAIVPTPAKEGASRLDATATIDTDETQRVVNALIDDGVSGIIALGTTGECATLNRHDYDTFVSCLLETVNRRIPVFIGTSCLGGHEVVSRMRLLQDLKADGTLLGLPMWQPMSHSGAVRFYAEMSDIFPDISIMVYANERAFRFNFSDDFWAEIVKSAPTVVAAKCSRPKDLASLLKIVGGRVNIVPNEMTLAHFYATAPEHTSACWATAASMGPRPVVELMRAVERRDDLEVQRLSAVLAWANETVTPIIRDKELFGMYTVQVEKTRINSAGYCNGGPLRPPYTHLPPEIKEAAEECGRRWRLLREQDETALAIPDRSEGDAP